MDLGMKISSLSPPASPFRMRPSVKVLCQKWLSTPWVRREPLLCSIPRSPVTCGKYSVTWLKVCVNSCLILQIVYLRFASIVVWWFEEAHSLWNIFWEHCSSQALAKHLYAFFCSLCFEQLECSFKSNHSSDDIASHVAAYVIRFVSLIISISP